MKRNLFLYLLLMSLLLQVGCRSAFQGVGSGLVDGMKKPGEIDSLTYRAMTGLIAGFTNNSSKEKIDSMIRSLGATLKLSTDSILLNLEGSVISIRDSLLGDYLVEHAGELREALTGKDLQKNITALLDTVIGDRTKAKIKKLISSVINEALSRSTRDKLNALLDTLGGTANLKLKMLIDTALAHVNTGATQLGKQANTELTFLQKYATHFLIIAGIILVAVIALLIYFFRKKKKYARLTDILTYQIHATKDEQTFNDLKYRISNQAKDENLEPLLRGVLQKKGILGEAARQSITNKSR
jgi:hypothetical protein